MIICCTIQTNPTRNYSVKNPCTTNSATNRVKFQMKKKFKTKKKPLVWFVHSPRSRIRKLHTLYRFYKTIDTHLFPLNLCTYTIQKWIQTFTLAKAETMNFLANCKLISTDFQSNEKKQKIML